MHGFGFTDPAGLRRSPPPSPPQSPGTAREARAASRGAAWGVCLLPGSRPKIPFRVPFCYQGRALRAGSSEVDRGEVGHPGGRRRALAGPGSRYVPLTLALVAGRRPALLLLPPSGAPGHDVAAGQACEFQRPAAPGCRRLIRSAETYPQGPGG